MYGLGFTMLREASHDSDRSDAMQMDLLGKRLLHHRSLVARRSSCVVYLGSSRLVT